MRQDRESSHLFQSPAMQLPDSQRQQLLLLSLSRRECGPGHTDYVPVRRAHSIRSMKSLSGSSPTHSYSSCLGSPPPPHEVCSPHMLLLADVILARPMTRQWSASYPWSRCCP